MTTASDVIRGTLRRFLPAAAITLGAVALPLILLNPVGLSAHWPRTLLMELGSLTWGFGLGLLLLLRKLQPDADVVGRRSIVAGICGPLGLLTASALIQPAGPPMQVLAAASVGALLALAMYAPWLSSAPSIGDRRRRELESMLDDPLVLGEGPACESPPRGPAPIEEPRQPMPDPDQDRLDRKSAA